MCGKVAWYSTYSRLDLLDYGNKCPGWPSDLGTRTAVHVHVLCMQAIIRALRAHQIQKTIGR